MRLIARVSLVSELSHCGSIVNVAGICTEFVAETLVGKTLSGTDGSNRSRLCPHSICCERNQRTEIDLHLKPSHGMPLCQQNETPPASSPVDPGIATDFSFREISVYSERQFIQLQIGAVAQLGERRVRNAKVEGSNPFGSI